MLKTEITMELNNNIIEKTQGSLKRRTFLKWHTFGILFTLLILGSCTKDLLEQIPTTELSPELFWRTTNDAAYAVNGVYEANRTTFGRDYYFDGAGESGGENEIITAAGLDRDVETRVVDANDRHGPS
jgi:hypothetical protein